jgi:peptidoglycan/LPS O-acetylase OafA/YrhL
MQSGQARGSGREAEHLVQLDGVRGLAVFLVLVAHGTPQDWYPLHLGAAGVILFFVLSGFLITGILLRARQQAEAAGQPLGWVMSAFYGRRFLRIFPLYYAVLAAGSLLGLGALRETLAWHAVYLSNYYVAQLGDWPRGGIGHLWSLSVEEQFYLLWPAVTLFTPRRWLVPVLLAAVVLAPCSRLAVVTLTGSRVAAHVITPSCLDALGLGALLAVLRQTGDGQAVRRLVRLSLVSGVVLYAVVLVLATCRRGWLMEVVLEDLAYALLSVWLVDRAAAGFGGAGRAVFEFPPLVNLGIISYGVYVFHQLVPPLMMLLEERLGVNFGFPRDRGVILFAYKTLVGISLAALSWHFLEKPLNNLKRYLPYVSARPLILPATTVNASPRVALGKSGIRPRPSPRSGSC